jgi:outer membrane protein OmpA-like peptidoglycan-associated protein
MGFNVRAKSAVIVAGAVLVFGVSLPLVNTGTISGATGNHSAVGKQSPVKKPVKKPVTNPVVHTLSVNVSFTATSATLSAKAKSQLAALAKKLVSGAKATIYGYSSKSVSLSTSRATAVEVYLKSQTKVKFSVKLVPTTGTSVNGATVKVTQP